MAGDEYRLPPTFALRCVHKPRRVSLTPGPSVSVLQFIPNQEKEPARVRKVFDDQVLRQTGSIAAAATALGDSIETAKAFYLGQTRSAASIDLEYLLEQ
jgi:hypothetical protein